ncbi:SOS response-associated peptidase [Paracoccus aestuariivivens]|uniref:Abasic site processing protein n=1 Tax=Paracoccus aestuariivivens TaxID=1820333 RepID=A0A6L6JEG7_9RHOB|nr:SOS response-associated peptidase [Paracoccus aestuariivivens]MTH79906.1 SOS response-associated peptidase [Paracoccus aestuariivivens]
MCGRFIDADLRGTDSELSQLNITPFQRRYNIKPTEDVLILAKQSLLPMMARWWLIPSWHKGDLGDFKPTTFNARIEDAREKPSFRAVWRFGRCLIPAGGYYEWSGASGHKQPHFIHNAGNEGTLWFAGLASRWQHLLTCTILTRAANGTVNDLHARMPVILNAEERDAWLAGSDDQTLGAGASLRHHLVHPFAISDDGPELIEPAQA